MFFLLTHPDGRPAWVRAASAQIARTQIVKKTSDREWNAAKVQIPREDGATCVILIGEAPKPRKVKVAKIEKAKPTKVTSPDPDYAID
jgi:hypothetical protein